MAIHVYQYPKCSTCRKALKWLDAHGVKYAHSDLVAEPIAIANTTMATAHRRFAMSINDQP